MIDINALIELVERAKETNKDDLARFGYKAAIMLADEYNFNDNDLLISIFLEGKLGSEIGKQLCALISKTGFGEETSYHDIVELGGFSSNPEWAKETLLSHTFSGNYIEEHISYSGALAEAGAIEEARGHLISALDMFDAPDIRTDVLISIRESLGTQAWAEDILKQYEKSS